MRDRLPARKDLIGRTVRIRVTQERDRVRGKVIGVTDEHLTLSVRGNVPARYAWTDVLSLHPVVNKETK